MTRETFTDQKLVLELEESAEEIAVRWFGTSMARDPGKFILPVLSQALRRSTDLRRPLCIDFTKVEYFNSSTITPVIRILEQARRGSNKVTIFYKKDLKWQELNFTALEIFRTEDLRIQIEGV